MRLCCSTFGNVAEEHFDETIARRDLAQYRASGPGPTTRLLCDLVEKHGFDGPLLDVGSGIGALTFELLDRGIERAVAVDASSAYLAAASEEAARRGRSDAVRFVHGDFLSLANQLPTTPVVTLDRVICCYPFYRPLLEAALSHAGRCFAFSYPRDVWHMRCAIGLENLLRRLRRDAFRAFVHPVAPMRVVIEQAGFRLADRQQTWLWSADVFIRI